jgi:hypothetical protein
MGYFGYVAYGSRLDEETRLNPEDFGKLIIGELPGHRFWEIRGSLILPLLFSVVIFGYHACYIRITVDMENDKAVIYRVSNALWDVARMLLVTHFMRTIFLPFALVALQIGYTSKARIGLWNRDDVPLSELQRLSMHGAIWCSVISLFSLIISYTYRHIINMSLLMIFLNGILLLALTLSIIFLPIVPVISVLRQKKEKLLISVFTQIETSNQNYLNLVISGDREGAAKEKANLDQLNLYSDHVSNLKTIPSAVEVINTTLFSAAMTVLPAFLVFVFSSEK